MDKQTSHYSIFRGQSSNGEIIYISLAHVTAIECKKSGTHYLYCYDDLHSLDQHNGEAAIAAWNRYKYAIAAAQLIKIPDQVNPTIACNSALRVDEFIGFLAEQKIKELAELAEEKAA